MELEGSLPHSQVPTNSPYPSQLNPVHIPTSHFLKLHLNIILPSTPVSPKWPLSLRFPHQNLEYASPIPYTRYMPRPSHSSRFYQPNNIVWAVQIIKQYRSLRSSLYSFLHSHLNSSLLGPNIPLTPYFYTPSACIPPSVWATKFHTHTKHQPKFQWNNILP